MHRIETVHLDKLIPYWRNPRNNDKAIEKVTESIREYGYQSPIIVDEKHTIIVGHSRYRALKELGYEEIQVVVSDMDAKKAKEYRIIDNRTSEYATWTDELQLELKEFTDTQILDTFFPDIKLDPDFQRLTDHVTQDKIEEQTEQYEDRFTQLDQKRQTEPRLEVPCPNCLETISLTRTEVNRLGNWTTE